MKPRFLPWTLGARTLFALALSMTLTAGCTGFFHMNKFRSQDSGGGGGGSGGTPTFVIASPSRTNVYGSTVLSGELDSGVRVTYDITYSDYDNITLSAADVSFSGSSGAWANNISVSGSGATRTVTVWNFVGNGTAELVIAAGTAENDGNLASGDSNAELTVTECVTQGSGFHSGTGAFGSSYQICSIEQFNNIVAGPMTYYRLLTDLDDQDDEIVPVTGSMNGEFAGWNHSISNFNHSFATPATPAGLFESGTNFTVSDLSLIDVDISANVTSEPVGALVGSATGGGFNNVFVSGTVRGLTLVGGIAGSIDGGHIQDSGADVTVEATMGGIAGGLAANIEGDTDIDDSYSAGIVRALGATDIAGGIVGQCDESHVERSTSSATVSGRSSIGGILGVSLASCHLSSVAFSGAVTSTGNGSGGISGQGGVIESANFSGTISGASLVGGIAGILNACDVVSNSVSTGPVVASNQYAAGLVGTATYGIIAHSYSTSSVSAIANAGGLVASNTYGRVFRSYWNTDTSGQPTSPGGGEGRTTVQLEDPSNYLEWNTTDVWDLVSGSYPAYKSPGRSSWIPFDNGNGSVGTPYLISTPYHLTAASCWSGLTSYSMDGFVDMAGHTLRPFVSAMDGVFNGDGQTIANLSIESNGTEVGLFPSIGITGEVLSLIFSNPVINCSACNAVGVVAGSNFGRIANVTVNEPDFLNSGTGAGSLGGLAGRNEAGATIEQSTVFASTSGAFDGVGLTIVGGIAGSNMGTLTDVNGNAPVWVENADFIGGLVGDNQNILTSSAATESVQGNTTSSYANVAGGLVGRNAGAISSTSHVGEVRGYVVGGLVGSFEGPGSSLADCYHHSGLVVADSSSGTAGGLFGLTNGNAAIQNSYVSAMVSVLIGGTADCFGGGGTPASITAAYHDSDVCFIGNALSTDLPQALLQDGTFLGAQGWGAAWDLSGIGVFAPLN